MAIGLHQVGTGASRASVMIDGETRAALEEITRVLKRSAQGHVDRNVAVKSAVMHYVASLRAGTASAAR